MSGKKDPIWHKLVAKKLGLPAQRVERVERTRDIKATMPDGAVLLADLWQPVGVTDAPTVLIRTPYGRWMYNTLVGRFLAHQGFQVVMQACRGTDGSGGQFDRPFLVERADGAATVEWLRQQPWYSGKLIPFGDSYIGHTALGVAAAGGDDLVAVVLRVAPLDLSDMIWPDGSFAIESWLSWCALSVDDPRLTIPNAIKSDKLRAKVGPAGLKAPLMESYREVGGKKIGFFEESLTRHEASDAYWRDSDLTSLLDTITVPVLIEGGWYDLFLKDELVQFEKLSEREARTELLLGPWTHGDMLLKAAGRTLGDAAAFMLDVTGLQPQTKKSPKFRAVEINSLRELDLAHWPVKPAEQKVLHLAGNGQLFADASGVTGPTQTTFTYDPADPTPSVGGTTNGKTAGSADNTKLETRADVITFTSAPLTEELRVLGMPKVELSFSSDCTDTALFVRLCEVRADGTSMNVTDRMLQLKAKDRDANGTWKVTVELPATCISIAAGHKVRLQLSSAAYPRLMRHPNTAEPVSTATEFKVAHQIVHHDPEHSASISLPVTDPREATEAR